MTAMLQRFKAARSRGVPLIAITTPDPAATVAALTKLIQNGKPDDAQPPILEWDLVRGPQPVKVKRPTNPGEEEKIGPQPAAEQWLEEIGYVRSQPDQPGRILVEAEKLTQRYRTDPSDPNTQVPIGGVVFMHNMQNFLTGAKYVPAVAQAICNLRDPCKASRVTIVLLGPDIELPPELQQDVLILDEPLPDEQQLETIARELYEAHHSPLADYSKVVAGITGLAAFPSEQALAMSLTKQGVDLDELWIRKQKTIEQTPGLKFETSKITFDDIGGLEQIKKFCRSLLSGRQPPKLIVRLEELEKITAGQGGDLSGVSDDQLAVMLTEMEDNGWGGAIAVGSPGAGKSEVSKALGNAANIKTIVLDLGACTGSLVGESQSKIRQAMKIIKALAGRDVFFIASCNRSDTINSALKRRFKYGQWMFDLPSKEELAAIWKIHRAKFEIPADMKTPSDEGWSGADIRNVCEIAWRMNTDLAEASQYIVPAFKNAGKEIAEMRDMADGKFLSASYPGVYQKQKTATQGRKISME